MPEICRFFGIIIRMYPEPLAPHHRPHFHAYYQDSVGVYAIDTIELIAGALPRRHSVWLRLGQNCIKKNCWQIGNDYNRGECFSKSTLFNKGDRCESSYLSRGVF